MIICNKLLKFLLHLLWVRIWCLFFIHHLSNFLEWKYFWPSMWNAECCLWWTSPGQTSGGQTWCPMLECCPMDLQTRLFPPFGQSMDTKLASPPEDVLFGSIHKRLSSKKWFDRPLLLLNRSNKPGRALLPRNTLCRNHSQRLTMEQFELSLFSKRSMDFRSHLLSRCSLWTSNMTASDAISTKLESSPGYFSNIPWQLQKWQSHQRSKEWRDQSTLRHLSERLTIESTHWHPWR